MLIEVFSNLSLQQFKKISKINFPITAAIRNEIGQLQQSQKIHMISSFRAKKKLYDILFVDLRQQML